jgi:glycerol-3-phosphate dehydrogenase (NAD(P)+)
MTRGLAEIVGLGVAMGAERATFAGLTGMGDLITTCTSRHSRNRGLGEALGKGQSLQDALNGMVMVAEGVRTTKSAYQLSKKYRVKMPITEAVYGILFGQKGPHSLVYALMEDAGPE